MCASLLVLVTLASLTLVASLRQDSAVISNLKTPIDLTVLPNGALLVAQQDGQVKHYTPSTGALATWLIVNQVDTYGERGLLGAEIHPNYPQQPYLYLFYCHNSAKAVRISRFTAQATGFNSNSELVLWQDPEPLKGPYHYGGGLVFDSQLNLYFSTGDKSFSTSNTHGQRLYRLNANNVAAGKSLQTATVLAQGLRNPWKMRYLPASNSLLIFDVGGNQLSISHEEIQLYSLDTSSTSTDYGFPSCEGPCNNLEFGSGCRCQQHTSPWLNYRHSGLNSAVVNGFFTDNKWSSQLKNGFVFADYARSKLYFTAVSNGQPNGNLVDVGSTQGQAIELQPDGATGLYYLTLGGQLRHVTYDNALAIASADVGPLSGKNPLVVKGSYTHVPSVLPPGWSVDWLVDGVPKASNQDLSTTLASVGSHVVALQTRYNNAQVHVVDTWTVMVGEPLDLTIQVNKASFKAGDTLQFVADAGSTPLSSLALSWQLLLWHDNHHHLLASNGIGVLVSHVVPTAGHSFEGDTAIIAKLTAIHADGRTGTAEVRLNPVKSDVTFQTAPVLPVTLQLDGESRSLPYTLDSAVGFKHQLKVPNGFCWQQQLFSFAHWTTSNTQIAASTTTLTVPDKDGTWTATYIVTDTCVRSMLSLSSLQSQLLVAFDANSESETSLYTWAAYLGSASSTLVATTITGKTTSIPIVSPSPSWSFAQLDGSKFLSASISDWTLAPTPAYTVAVAVRYHSAGWGGISFGKPACVQALGVGVSGLSNGQGGNLMAEAFCSNEVTQSKRPAVGAGWLLHTVTFCDGQMKHYINTSIVSTESVPLKLEPQRLVVGSDPSQTNGVAMDVRWFGVWNRCLNANGVSQLHRTVYEMPAESSNDDAVSSDTAGSSSLWIAGAEVQGVSMVLLTAVGICWLLFEF